MNKITDACRIKIRFVYPVVFSRNGCPDYLYKEELYYLRVEIRKPEKTRANFLTI